MKTVYRIHQKDLKKMIEDHLQKEGDQASTLTKPQSNVKLKVFFTEAQITFLEEMLVQVEPDNSSERDMLTQIGHMLKDCLINR